MKQLSDADIEEMIAGEFAPDADAVRRTVRSDLHMSTRVPQPAAAPRRETLDLHEHTVEQAWGAIMELATSGVKYATIITGASGVLKPLFQKWVRDSLLTPYVVSSSALNNGSFAVQFRKINTD